MPADPASEAARRRTFAIISHPDAGKTTLTESLLLGAGVIVAAMWFSGETYEREYYVLESKYAVTGLNVQAPVRLRGVEVGKVESIGFDPENPRLILIRIHVRQGTPITPNIIAQLGTQGVTGLAYVMLEERNARSEPVDASTREKSRIPVARSFLDAVAGSGNDLLTEINLVAQKVNKLLDEKNQAELLRMITAVQALSERATVLAQKFEPAAQGIAADTRETLKQAGAMLKNMSALTEQLAQRAGNRRQRRTAGRAVGGDVAVLPLRLLVAHFVAVHSGGRLSGAVVHDPARLRPRLVLPAEVRQ